MDFSVLADLVILLMVLVLPLVSHGVERNLEAFLFVMGALSAWAAGVLSTQMIRDALMHLPRIGWGFTAGRGPDGAFHLALGC